MIKKSLLLMLLMALMAPWAANAQETLTVHDGTGSNSYVPVYGNWADAYLKCEFVVPADELAQMDGGIISQMDFYMKSSAAAAWTGTFQVFLKEVNETTLSAWSGTEGATVVFEGNLDATGSTMTVAFSSSYGYGGGNLLVGIYQTAKGNYKSCSFYGETVTGASGSNYSSSSLDGVSFSQRNFIPKTTFTYELPSTGCDMPTSLVADPVEAHEVTLTWDGSSDTYAVAIKGGSYTDWYLVEDGYMGKTITISGLSANTPYQARVQSICTSGESNWKTVGFTTPIACQAPTGLAVTLTPGDGTVAEFSWTENGTATTWQLCLDGDETNLIDMDKNPFMYDQFTPEQTYTAKVRAYCDVIDQSEWSNTVTFTPTDSYNLTVNDGTTNNGYIPVYGYYVDGSIVSQFIMPAADLAVMQYGTINQLTFYASQASVGWANAIFEVYMMEVDYTTFSSTTLVDWASMEKVMNAAHLEISGNQMVVTLDAPYQYMGGNLMIGFKQTTSGTWGTSTWYGIEATGASLGGNNSGSQQNFLPKTTFAYTPGSAPACAKPTSLAVNYTGGTEATVSWNSEATAWNIDVNGTVTAITTNPHTLTGLELDKTYEVKVQADCGGGTLSDWTNAVSFTTDMCMPADQCELTFILTDSYGDSWNGNAIQVVDVATGIVVATMANENLDGQTQVAETQTVTLAVCDGREIQFVWVKGSYPGEASWIITDVNGEEITSGTGTTSMNTGDVLATYTVNCTVTNCKKPTDLAVSEIGNHSAKLSWTEKGLATEWVVAYSKDGATYDEVDASTNPFTLTGLDPETDYLVKVRPVCSDFDDKWSDEEIFTTDVACPAPTIGTITTTPFTATVEWTGYSNSYVLEYAVDDYTPSSTALWLQYDNGTLQTNVGNTTVYTWQWGVMYPATELSGNSYLNKVAFYESSYYIADAPITISIYSGGDTEPGTLLYEEDATCLGVVGVHEVTLQQPVAIDPTENLWIVLTTTTIDRPMAMCAVDEANGRWLNNGGNWIDIGSSLTSVATYSWMIRGFIDSKAPTYNWTTVSDVTSPYLISGLQAETDYFVRVKGDCGTDGESEWAYASFTTPSACDAPYNIINAEVLINEATISWSGYQESYNIRYRTAAGWNDLFFEGFESGIPSTWTTIDADEDGNNWLALDDIMTTYPYYTAIPDWAHNGDNAAISPSYANGVGSFDSDHWLISPQLDLQGYLRFYVMSTYSDEDSYEVLLSTTSTATTDFTTTLQAMTTATNGSWDEISIDLSSYSGKGYIAIHHVSSDKYFLVVDDFSISELITAGTWNTVANQISPATITTLLPDTDYEFQVQGINPKCDPDGVTDWSTSFFFTTLADEPIAILDGGDWNQNSTWINSGGEVPAAGTDVIISGDVIIPAGYTAVAGEITFANGGTLTIQEGGGLQHTEEVELTMNLTIGGYSKENPSGYNLIAAPTYTTTTYSLPIQGTNLNTGTFDLYYFDQYYDGAEWRNYKVSTNYFTDLNLAQGYLYANQGGADIKFTGLTYPTDDVIGVDLYFVDGKPFEGLNLIGNPYTCTTYINSSKTNSGSTAKPFFELVGTAFVAKDAGTPIAPLKGIFVEAAATTDSIFFFTTAPSSAKSTLDITVNQGSEMIDNAIIDFKAGSSLTKFQFNPNSTKVYMPVDGKDYAVVSAEEQGEMPVCFKAEENGTYTMSFTSENTKFSYLHLIDNMTGADVDLLVNPNYTFNARYTDYASRFKLVFATGNNDSESNFGFISDGNLMILGIEGEATLQMIDVTGRILSTETFSGSYNKALNASAGVYMLRLIQGENVRTQKIVVK